MDDLSKFNNRWCSLVNYLKTIDFRSFKFYYSLFSLPPLPSLVPAASLQGGEGKEK